MTGVSSINRLSLIKSELTVVTCSYAVLAHRAERLSGADGPDKLLNTTMWYVRSMVLHFMNHHRLPVFLVWFSWKLGACWSQLLVQLVLSGKEAAALP